MKILIIYRHYWPDLQPMGAMLRMLGEHLASRGHRVTVFTTQPRLLPGRGFHELPAREFVGGVRVIRAKLPAAGMGQFGALASWTAFLAQAFAYAARHRFHLVWTTALPPVVNGIVGVLSSRASGARFLYHVESVHPEARIIAGSMRDGALAGIASKIDSWICRIADAVVVQSDDMTRTIADRGGNGAVAFHILPSFVLHGLGEDRPPPERLSPGTFRLVYVGHVGRFQGLERLLDAMAHIEPAEGIALEIIGSGESEATLRHMAKAKDLTHVRFVAPVPAAEAFRLMRSADVGVVSLAPGGHRVSFPSKLMTYLAAGLPVLALVDPDSAIGRYLKENEAGMSLDGTAGNIAAAIRTMKAVADRREAERARLAALAEGDFGRENACARWAELVESFGTD